MGDIIRCSALCRCLLAISVVTRTTLFSLPARHHGLDNSDGLHRVRRHLCVQLQGALSLRVPLTRRMACLSGPAFDLYCNLWSHILLWITRWLIFRAVGLLQLLETLLNSQAVLSQLLVILWFEFSGHLLAIEALTIPQSICSLVTELVARHATCSLHK